MIDSAVKTRQTPKAIIGLLLGMGVGVLVAALLEANMTFGLGMGMFAGHACGYCIDRSQPKRSRVVLGIFTFVLVAVCAYSSLLKWR